MKINRLIRLLVVALLTFGLTATAQANDLKKDKVQKKSVTLNMEKPIIDYLAKIYGESLHSEDVARVQRFLGQIENVTITFRDKDAADYVLVFKDLDEQQLEQWMFDEGYLTEESESVAIEPWMTDPAYLE